MTYLHLTQNEWPNNRQSMVDSRDIIARIAMLADTERDADEQAEYETLTALATQGETLDDWEYGVTLVSDTYFTAYAQVLADDLGVVDGNASWPLYCIDWERAARDLQMDYTPLEWDGTTYWAR